MAKFDPMKEGATPFNPAEEGASPVGMESPGITQESAPSEDSDPRMRELAINMARFIFSKGADKASSAFGTAAGMATMGTGIQDIRPIARGAVGIPEQEGAPISSQALNIAGNVAPQVASQAALAALTGGASVPVQGAGLIARGAAMAAPALSRAAISGVVSAGQKGTRDIIEGGSPEGMVAEAGKSAIASLGVESFFGAAGKAFRMSKPGLVRLGAQLMKSTSAVPEKYGKAVLENPAILTEAPTLKVASAMYGKAVRGLKGANDFLSGQEGTIAPKPQDAIDLIDSVMPKIGTQTPPTLQEALAARQSLSNMLEMAKFGDPRMRASKKAFIAAKEQLDDFLELGMPGFKKETKNYFEANAREAFQSLLPQNKNLSANALRSLGALSALSAGALLKAPFVLAGAAAFSPKATGLMIRGGKSVSELMASQAAQFATRVGAVKAVESGPNNTTGQ